MWIQNLILPLILDFTYLLDNLTYECNNRVFLLLEAHKQPNHLWFQQGYFHKVQGYHHYHMQSTLNLKKIYTRSLHNAIFGTRKNSHYARNALTKTNFTSANIRTTEILRHYECILFQIWILHVTCNHSVYQTTYTVRFFLRRYELFVAWVGDFTLNSCCNASHW